MGISKKGKRRIVIDGRAYLWWVFHEIDQTSFDGDQIKLVAEDQSHAILYGLQQWGESRSIVISLRNDGGIISLDCPVFEDENGIITPSGIRKLIEWCKIRPDENHIRTIVHAYEPRNSKPYPLPEDRVKILYESILEVLNRQEYQSKL